MYYTDMYDIYPIICTREARLKPITNELINYFDNIDIKTQLVINASSIFTGYEEGLIKIKPKPQDIIILCHDDIKILNDPSYFTDYLEILHKSKTGFIGVAGTASFNDPCIWWQSPRNDLRGIVWHGDNHVTSPATYF